MGQMVGRSGAAKPGVAAGSESPASGPETAAVSVGRLAAGECGRPSCRRAFTGRGKGSPQRYCSARCRRAHYRELERAARGRAAKPRAREHSAAYWRTGIDAATGRRVPVRIKTPAELVAEIRAEAAAR